MELSDRRRLAVVPLLGEGDLLIAKLEQKLPLSKVLDKLYALLREMLFLTGPVDYLFPLKTFIDLTRPMDIFTLNYDLSLETAFDTLKLCYSTGYRQREEELAVWDPSQFTDPSLDVRIFKLHGSINWGSFYGCPPPLEEGRSFDASEQARRYLANYPEHVQFEPYPVGPVEPPGRTTGMVSIMNFGTRKEQLYASSQFTTLFNYLLTGLGSANTVVIAGYSFQDRAINKLIEEATLERKGTLSLVLVNPLISWIEQRYPLLREIVNLGWASTIDKPLSEALSTGAVRDAVDASLKTRTKPEKNDSNVAVNPHISDPVHVDPEQVLETWRQLGITFDLAYYWWKRLEPEVREIQQSMNERTATKLGKILLPLIRKVRDLCHHIRWLYEELHFDDTYGGKYLESIIVAPKPNGKLTRI